MQLKYKTKWPGSCIQNKQIILKYHIYIDMILQNNFKISLWLKL